MKLLNPKTRAGFLLLIGAILSSCNLSTFSGYGYTITAHPEQESIHFECKTSTVTGKCHVAIGIENAEARVTKAVAVGTTMLFDHAPVGTQYCVSQTPVLWETCGKSSVVSGTTSVESGRTVSGFHLFKHK
jgi:hypothetical protein